MSDSEWGYAADARMTSVELAPFRGPRISL